MGSDVAVLTDEQIDLVKRTIMPDGASDDELQLFLNAAKRTGLDPFQRQIYAIRIGRKVQVQASIDGFRVVAERTGQMNGQQGPFWCGENGEWKDVWLSDEAPSASKIEIYRKGMEHPFTGVALWREYAVFNSSGQLTHMWRKMPSLMLAKCAESLALRKAFPNDLSGLYTEDEMDQAGQQVRPAPSALANQPIVEDDLGPPSDAPTLPKRARKKPEEPKIETDPEPPPEPETEPEPAPEAQPDSGPMFGQDGEPGDHVEVLKETLKKLTKYPEWGEENVLANCRSSFNREILKLEDLTEEETGRILKVIEDSGYLKDEA